MRVANFLLVAFFIIITSCVNGPEYQLKNGMYRGVLQLDKDRGLPFLFEVTSPTSLKVFNAEEVIDIDEITYKNDSVYIKFPVFEGELIAKVNYIGLEGDFVVKGKNRSVPFSAKPNTKRFDVDMAPKFDVSGQWEVTFSPHDSINAYPAKGIFKQNGSQVTGTFRTKTGDYRFLEGVVNGNQLKLSTLDGAHAFLFSATVGDSTMQGNFYSGSHWKEPFIAKRNANFELPDSNTLTYLKEGYDGIEFSFPDANGTMVSLSDERFKDKVVLVQIMGTWCPNCLDESKFYSEFYKNNKDKGLEIVALAFEYAKTKDKAFNLIDRLKTRIGIDYPVLLAQYGTTSKSKANDKLPMLNHVLSYPTTIFIDKKGKVRKIHTGFNGPATGEKYTEFVDEFETFVGGLLQE